MKLFVALMILVICEACSTSVIVKDCTHTPDADGKEICKTVLPWK